MGDSNGLGLGLSTNICRHKTLKLRVVNRGVVEYFYLTLFGVFGNQSFQFIVHFGEPVAGPVRHIGGRQNTAQNTVQIEHLSVGKNTCLEVLLKESLK
jgi:hypothetical protein